MADRSTGIGWFAVGFLAGVGATLAAIIFATRPQPTRLAAPAPAPPAAAVVTYHAPVVPQASLPSPPPASAQQGPAPAAAPPARPVSPDQVTGDDAAAAGMTSRTRPGG